MKIYQVLFLSFFFVACTANEEKKSADCKAILIEDCSCLQVYEPVCGCDKVTYPNSCYAECSSILTFTEGECL